MRIRKHWPGALIFLLSISQYACGNDAKSAQLLDAAADSSGDSGSKSNDGIRGSADTSVSNGGSGGSQDVPGNNNGASGASGIEPDAAAKTPGDESDASKKPDWAGCPGKQPEQEGDCGDKAGTVCTYGEISCICQEAQWVCSGPQGALDAGESTESDGDKKEDAGGPKRGPWSDGGTMGSRHNGDESGRSKDGG
jgi:hypothetical protein